MCNKGVGNFYPSLFPNVSLGNTWQLANLCDAPDKVIVGQPHTEDAGIFSVCFSARKTATRGSPNHSRRRSRFKRWAQIVCELAVFKTTQLYADTEKRITKEQVFTVASPIATVHVLFTHASLFLIDSGSRRDRFFMPYSSRRYSII